MQKCRACGSQDGLMFGVKGHEPEMHVGSCESLGTVPENDVDATIVHAIKRLEGLGYKVSAKMTGKSFEDAMLEQLVENKIVSFEE